MKEQIGRQPLDVGADRIARTAFAALALLEKIRLRLGKTIPLSWQPEDISYISVIEVYPAATLSVNSFPPQGYKKKNQLAVRQLIIEHVSGQLTFPEDHQAIYRSADALDAVICVLAGSDYLRGKTMAPPPDPVIRKEGWIWVKRPST